MDEESAGEGDPTDGPTYFDVTTAMALVHFVLAGLLWFIFLGWIIHIWSIVDAAMWSPRR